MSSGNQSYTNITLADINEALALVKEDRRTVRKHFDWGWIDYDLLGQEVAIGLNETCASTLKSLYEHHSSVRQEIPKCVPIRIYGIEVYVTPKLHEEPQK